MRTAVAVCLALGVATASAEGRLPRELLPSSSRAEIVINIPEFSLRYYVDGKLSLGAGIAVGKQLAKTELGEYYIKNKAKYPTWYPEGRPSMPPGPDNPLGTRWMGLDRNGYGIHGTIWPWSIGSAASSGCIRMRNEVVEQLFDMVAVGTPVRLVYVRTLTSGATAPGNAWVRVFTDIYLRDGSRMDNVPRDDVRARMEGSGMARIFADADKDLLWQLLQVSRGEKVYIPYGLQFTIDGLPEKLGAVLYRGERLVPLQPIATYLGVALSFSAKARTATLDGQAVAGLQVLAGRVYGPPAEVQRVLGVPFSYSAASKVISLSTRAASRPAPSNTYGVRVDGAPVDDKAFMGPGGLVLPIRAIALAIGVSVEFDSSSGLIYVAGNRAAGTMSQLMVSGKSYVMADDLERMLGVFVGVDDVDRAVDVSSAPLPGALDETDQNTDQEATP